MKCPICGAKNINTFETKKLEDELRDLRIQLISQAETIRKLYRAQSMEEKAK